MNAKKLLPRKGVIEDAEGDGGDEFGGEMRSNEVIDDPISIEPQLQSGLIFGVGVGLAPITGQPTTEGTVKSFEMVGMNVLIVQGLIGFRMLRVGAWYLGRLRPGL